MDYSEETARAVEAAFHDLEASDAVVTTVALARLTGVSQTSVRHILRVAPYWTAEHRQRALREGWRKTHEIQQAAGYPNLRRGSETNKAAGYPSLRRGRATHWHREDRHAEPGS